jgi:hypothetical protein
MTLLYLTLLDELERQEVQSQTWGYVDGSFSHAQVLRLASKLSKTSGTDQTAPDLIEDLLDKKLIFDFEGRIRTRFAETLRLLVRLRQLFPGRPWQGSPRLVSDFRVDLRRRRYPSRNRDGVQIAKDHNTLFAKNPMRLSLWSALTTNQNILLGGFQERAIIRILSTVLESGTIVTAGTGSGKTLAFYLPALISIAEKIQPKEFWTKALAVYPRNELLKDQFAEAYRQCQKLEHILITEGRRPILIGTLFSSTPRDASHAALVQAKWPTHRAGFICPWLKCPVCESSLIWRTEDMRTEKEELHCSNKSCGHVLPQKRIILTRNNLHKQTPDILFTTTEMLNQRMSDVRMRALFGIGQPIAKRPMFMLLDEVHTYSGTSGAQAAIVLRRWRHLVDSRTVWVGLSATLDEAPRFFAELTGLSKEQIEEVTPTESEMIFEGAEYQIVLRGDPTLQASLLSTSIQAAMLMGRSMNKRDAENVDDYFGSRVFAFTDDLDVTNRLFDNLRDAEAYTIFGKEDPSRLPLAAMRGEQPRDSRRDLDGQRWRLCERIDRNLNSRLVIGRTTSQDLGVLDNADVVVATAALEVGYNDDEVGVVIQHKAPKNIASFLQRKGRAGRKRGMRPFTITVLSEYGRDRVAYQAYEHIFDPVVPAQHLPVQNQYVLRIQAVFALFDWIANCAKSGVKSGWLWNMLSRPAQHTPPTMRTHVKAVLTALSRQETAHILSLTKHLESSLSIPKETVDSLLWESPRSLILEVIPTLVRRFFQDWKLAYPTAKHTHDLYWDYHPLPEFIPRTLFDDLNLPEVQIQLPAATTHAQETTSTLPILAALLQLAPGRVTRRFAFQRGGLNHWIKVSTEFASTTISIDDYAYQNEFLGAFNGQGQDGVTQTFPVFRPLSIRLNTATRSEALPTSTAFPLWISAFISQGESTIIDVPPHSVWFDFVKDVRFHLHRYRGSVTVRRFFNEVHASVRQVTGDHLIKINYNDRSNNTAAVGFELEVDGFYIDFNLPPIDELIQANLSKELEASSRLAYFRYLFLASTALPKSVNSLQREWIFQIFISASVDTATKRKISLGTAAQQVLADNPSRTFSHVLRTLFQVRDSETGSVDEQEIQMDEEEQDPERISRLEERLAETIARDDVLLSLQSIAVEMLNINSSNYGRWLRQLIHETLAQAVLQACTTTSPLHTAVDSLVSDIETNDNDLTSFRIWVTETTLGGAGIIQAFAEKFAAEPRSLFRALEAALAPNDIEMASHGLKHFVSLVCTDTTVKTDTLELCNAISHEDRSATRRKLYANLSTKGLDVGHVLSISLNARLFRPGTQSELYALLNELLTTWESIEDRFNLALGIREFSYIAVNLPDIKPKLETIVVASGGTTRPTTGDLVQVLESLLWPRGMEIRQKALDSYNPFRQRRVSDPGIIRALLLHQRIIKIDAEDDNWRERLADALANSGTVELYSRRSKEGVLRKAIVEAVATPIDVGYMQFYPIVERFERTEIRSSVALTLREYV